MIDTDQWCSTCCVFLLPNICRIHFMQLVATRSNPSMSFPRWFLNQRDRRVKDLGVKASKQIQCPPLIHTCCWTGHLGDQWLPAKTRNVAFVLRPAPPPNLQLSQITKISESHSQSDDGRSTTAPSAGWTFLAMTWCFLWKKTGEHLDLPKINRSTWVYMASVGTLARGVDPFSSQFSHGFPTRHFSGFQAMKSIESVQLIASFASPRRWSYRPFIVPAHRPWILN